MKRAILLKTRQVVELLPRAPFHFNATLHKPDHFPSADNAWEPGIRWQTMRWHRRPLGLKFEDCGTVSRPRVRLGVWSKSGLAAAELNSLTQEIGYRYNLALDLADFNRRFQADPQLGPALRQWRGMRPMSPGGLYEYLLIAIVLQNATVRRSVQMLQTLLEHYGDRLKYDGRTLYGFWEPAALNIVSEEELRSLKVGYRAKSIQRVTAAFASQGLDELALRALTPAARREALLGLYGIGPASVGYILFDVFHQWDELNYISPWEQKIYSKLFFDADPETPMPAERLLDLFRARFGGYRMLAVHYLWEDLFWKRRQGGLDWLDKLIRL